MRRRSMNFEDALYQLKLGNAVRRLGWGDSIWIFMVPEAGIQVPHKFGGGYRVMSTLWVKTAEDALMAYCISQTDVLGDDWELVENPVRADQKTIAQA